jgi:hypothetical protein
MPRKVEAHVTSPKQRDRRLPGSRRADGRRRSAFHRLALFWLVGVGILFAAIATAALLFQLGFFIVAIIGACLCGLLLIPFGYLVAVDGNDGRVRDGEIFAVALCGTLIAVAASIVGQEQVVLWGGTARDALAAEAPGNRAAFYHFRHARVLTGRTAQVAVYAGTRGTRHLSYYAGFAPVVDADWVPGRPVAAFAVVGAPQFGHRRSDWRQPWNAGILVNAALASEQERALQDFRRDLDVAANPVFLRWSADPEGEAAGARARLVRALLIGTAFWSLAIAIGLVVAALRRRRERSGVRSG